ncbi:hypothetical protein [Haloarchaeobius sp. HME9146]|uniref:DUF7504 family protein n=1 Tax=Haloarchaeobius sp. HME9146 TaxID=2978732 RepID=UPI0021BF5011|nr:hypothetical protein [Haloarchaeobius sp. HME9146]MCT9096608.1 hypothetical protein [Haloarchaeobius sp. HME9146]
MRTEHGGGVPESTAFAQTLSALKEDGSSILLVGRTSSQAHKGACRRLMGDDGDEPRQRLYVYTLDNESCGHGPDATTVGSTKLVSQVTEDGTSSSPAVGPDVDETIVRPELLSTLGTEVIDAIDDLAEDDPTPGELRLCFDSVTPLLREHKSQNVFRLLHMVTSRIRQEQGMGHFHLPLDRDSDYVRLLEPLFDAVVEVRRDEETETLEQRWHLRDRDADSGWIPL